MARHARPSQDGAEAVDARRTLSSILLCGFLFVSSLANAVYSSQGIEPSARFVLLNLAGFTVLLWYWFVQQLARYRPAFPLDMGVFVTAFWFALMPYYFWRYERWRGLLKLTGLCGVYFLAWAFSLLVYFALR